MQDSSRTGLEESHSGAGAPEPWPSRPVVPTSAADWEARKHIIRELYMEQNMILNEVIEIMLTKHKFKATARMYKGQFAKWKWTKYNKSGDKGSTRPTKSRAFKKRGARAPEGFGTALVARMRHGAPARGQQLVPLSHRLQLQHFSDEEFQVEATLSAYSVLISHWSERDTPWRAPARPRVGDHPGDYPGDYHGALAFELGPPVRSVLQCVRTAQDHFRKGRPQLGGALLRRAFLGVEAAVDGAGSGLGIEALWDCCLAVPQLALTTGWADLLSIFARYLHQLTSIKLPGHPLTKVAASLHRLASCFSSSCSSSSSSSSSPTSFSSFSSLSWSGSSSAPPPPSQQWQLKMFVQQAWHVWIDYATRVRGQRDDVTIHLKRGYVTLVDPYHAMAGDIIRDFGSSVEDWLVRRGAFATTSRILELENLLARMYAPLFTPQTARRAEAMLATVVARIEDKPSNVGVPLGQWTYLDRYLIFSAHFFMASIAEYNGEPAKAAWLRARCLDSPRDLFWLQTSLLIESRLRAEGEHEEANAIQEARAEVQSKLGLPQGELRLTGEDARARGPVELGD